LVQIILVLLGNT